MAPPVALLAYAADTPEQAVFWPFARFSPEYQAVCWAVRHGVPVRFIDLPCELAPAYAAGSSGRWSEMRAKGRARMGMTRWPPTAAEPPGLQIHRDPIGVLAHAAGL